MSAESRFPDPPARFDGQGNPMVQVGFGAWCAWTHIVYWTGRHDG
jgi:hypothetical protein